MSLHIVATRPQPFYRAALRRQPGEASRNVRVALLCWRIRPWTTKCFTDCDFPALQIRGVYQSIDQPKLLGIGASSFKLRFNAPFDGADGVCVDPSTHIFSDAGGFIDQAVSVPLHTFWAM